MSGELKTEEVRTRFADHARHLTGVGTATHERRFDVWFANEIRRAKADAWEEGACTGDAYGMTAISLNPLHANPYEDSAS